MKFYFIFFIIINILSLSKNEKLIYAELQCRHGARGPLKLFENNTDVLGVQWPYLGELTGVGHRMEYLLGYRNRLRYIKNYKFLSEHYDPHEILVFSTPLNRTLLSMSSQLQGLYPISEKLGEELNEKQTDFIPPVNVNCEEINEEINRLENYSLPNGMTIIPIHTFSKLEKRMSIYDHDDCKETVKNFTKKNEEKDTIQNIIKDFLDNEKKNFNTFFPEDFDYNFDNISLICDTIIADYTEGKNLDYFYNKTKYSKDNIEKLIDKCKYIIGTNFKDKLYGDEDNKVILLEESTVLKEMIHYMTKRVDDDKFGEVIENNASDYSRPKMVIRSGHDTTVAAQLLFLIKYFNLDINKYTLPSYSAQVAVEVTREEEKKKEKLEYSDYKVKYYFNEELILETTMDKFNETIAKNIWTEKQINDFCLSLNINNNNSNDTKNKLDKRILYLLIGIGVFTLLLLIIIIILVVKVIKLNKKDNDINSIDSDKLINEE